LTRPVIASVRAVAAAEIDETMVPDAYHETTYPVIAEPFVELGAAHRTVAFALPGVAVGVLGAGGADAAPAGTLGSSRTRHTMTTAIAR